MVQPPEGRLAKGNEVGAKFAPHPHQSEFLAWQIEGAFRNGLAGTVVFSYTDDWFRGGMQIEDWAFGLTTRDRRPKESFAAVQKQYRLAPHFPLLRRARVSVVVATYNGARTLNACLDSLQRLNYPDYEIILVDDGSTDRTPEIAKKFPSVRYVRQENLGLSAARNAGIAAATGEIVAFTDDDCLVDPSWLARMVDAFDASERPGFVTGQVRSDVEDRRRAWLAVSVTDHVAPRALRRGDDPRRFGHGANMGWRRDVLEQIGGFDDFLGVGSPLRAAEDVDAWWRALEAGETGWYTPDAVVVHRQWRGRREMLRSYYGYGIGAGALAVKRYRMAGDGASGRRTLAHALLVEDGPLRAARSLRRGHEMAALADTLLFLGAQRGASRAWRMSVAHGHFREVPDAGP